MAAAVPAIPAFGAGKREREAFDAACKGARRAVTAALDADPGDGDGAVPAAGKRVEALYRKAVQ